MTIESSSLGGARAGGAPNLRLPGWVAASIVVALVVVAGGIGALLMSQLGGQSLNVQIPGVTVPAAADTVTVVGEGRVAAAPDTIYTDIGASAVRSTLPDALAAVAADSSKLNAALTGAGIAAADIQTTGLSSWPRTDNYGSVTGYYASSSLRVRIRDISKVTSILNGAAASIGNDLNLGQLQYQRTDIAAQAAQARQLALAAAQDRASGLAKLSGRQLGKIASVEETFVGYVPAGQMVQGGIGAGGQGGGSFPQVQTGQGEVLVHLTVKYALN